MAIEDIRGCSLKDGEFLGCAHCGGGWVRQTTKHLQELAKEGKLRVENLPCHGLQESVQTALNLPNRQQ